MRSFTPQCSYLYRIMNSRLFNKRGVRVLSTCPALAMFIRHNGRLSHEIKESARIGNENVVTAILLGRQYTAPINKSQKVKNMFILLYHISMYKRAAIILSIAFLLIFKTHFADSAKNYTERNHVRNFTNFCRKDYNFLW